MLSTNLRAIRFYQKSGFVRCGAMIEAIKDRDKFIDLDIWALKSASLRDLATPNRSNPNKIKEGK